MVDGGGFRPTEIRPARARGSTTPATAMHTKVGAGNGARAANGGQRPTLLKQPSQLRHAQEPLEPEFRRPQAYAESQMGVGQDGAEEPREIAPMMTTIDQEEMRHELTALRGVLMGTRRRYATVSPSTRHGRAVSEAAVGGTRA